MDEKTNAQVEFISVLQERYVTDIKYMKDHFSEYEETEMIISNLNKILNYLSDIRIKIVS